MTQLLPARRYRLRDRSRKGRLHRWGDRSRRTCSRIRRYRTEQGSHGRNRGESGTASCSPRSGFRHAICRKWENPSADQPQHRTRHLDYLGQTRYPRQPHPVIARCLSDWLKESIRSLGVEHLIARHYRHKVFRVRQVDNIVSPAWDHVDGLNLVDENLKLNSPSSIDVPFPN